MEKIIQIKIEINCDIHRAFDLFTIDTLLESWLTKKAEVTLEVGGKYELFWEPENRDVNSTIGCTITGFEKNKYIAFDWKGPVQFQNFMNSSDPLTHVIVFFSAKHDDPTKTVIYLFHTGWGNDNDWQQARDYFENAWSMALKELQNNEEKDL